MRITRVERLGVRPGEVGDMNVELLDVARGFELARPAERAVQAERSSRVDLRVEPAVEEGANPGLRLEI